MSIEPEAHRDERCIEYLANLMREKMKFSREVKGRSGWQDMPADVLSAMLREHVEKGDPVDVANFCMMLAAKRAPISARTDAEAAKSRHAALQDAAENLLVAIGMGWDLEGAINATRAALTREGGV